MFFRRIAKGVSFSFAFVILGGLFTYLFRRMLALGLEVDQYGLFFAMIAFFSLLMFFVDFGLEPAVTKAIIELRHEKKEKDITRLTWSVLGVQLFFSLVIFFVIFLFSDLIALEYFHVSAAGHYIRVMSLWFLSPLTIFIAYILLGFERTTWYTGLDFFRMLFLILITTIVFFFDQGNGTIYGPLIAYAVINFVLFILYLPYMYSIFPLLFKEFFSSVVDIIHLRIPLLKIRSVFGYGLVMALTSFGWVIITQTDSLVLTYFSSLENVGLYNVALPIALLLLLCMRPFAIVFYPLVTSLATKNKTVELRSIIEDAFHYILLFLLPFVLPLLLFPEALITFLFSDAYALAASALVILGVGTLFYAFSMFNNVVLNGLGKAKYMAILSSIVAVLNLVLNILLIPQYGIIGAAFATSSSYILLFVSSTIALKMHVGFRFPFRSWGGIICSGLLSLGVVYGLRRFFLFDSFIGFVLGVVLLFGLYLCSVFVLGLVRWDHIVALVREARK
jgi:O-antigen/teichoic acid export membrane protein